MKKIIFSASLLLSVLLLAFSPASETEKYESLKVGDEMPIPNHVMVNITGDKLRLSDEKKENGTLIIFSCNTCPFVVNWEDRYNEIGELAKSLDVGTILVNSNEAKRNGDDSFEEMQARAKAQNYNMPYTVDKNSVLANAFGAKTTPHVYLFDAANKLVYVGAIDDNSRDKNEVKESYLSDALKQLAKGKKISTPSTKAIGCSIKRLD